MPSRKAPPLTRDNLITAIDEHFGNILSIARSFAVTRQTIYNHIQKDPELKALLDEAREHFIDFAEGALVTLIKKEDTAAIIFALKTRGKNRGYTERTEHTGADGKPIQTEHTINVLTQLSDDELDDIIAGRPPRQSGAGAEIDTA